MYYFTLNPNEMKREIKKFDEKITCNVKNKSIRKFSFEMLYGIGASGSCRLADIARSLKEPTKTAYIIDRLSDNLLKINEDEEKIIWNNYQGIVNEYIGEDPIAILDDSDIAKRSSTKLEDIDIVKDASSKEKELVPGYNVCEAVILGKREKQPISVYSKIYSCKSNSFVSKKTYTFESIDAVVETLNRQCTFVADRAYDDKKIYKYIEKKECNFVIRLDKRSLLFKGKSRNIKEVAKERKGKIRMDLMFEGEKKACYISHTKVQLEKSGKEYEFITVYGLGEEPLMLLTNREIKTTTDLRKVVRIYFSRWRVEEYFKAKKQEYGFEKYFVRTLKAMNILNMFLTMLIGYIQTIAEKININILGIKLKYASDSLREKVVVWLSQLARGLKVILWTARTGIKNLMNVEHQQSDNVKQLQLF